MDRRPPLAELAPASAHSARLRRVGRAVRFALRPLAAALTYAFLAPAHAQLPVGATVIHGSATIATSGARMTVTNSPSSILNWQSFSIGAPNGVHFQQQNATSQVLNRVTGTDPSQILGSLSSNGRVWLINPRGILFGQNARVDVAGLVASTLDIANADFLANRFNFVAASGTGQAELLNQGEIRASFGGRVWLLGERVGNEGLIETPGGNIVLAAGKSIELIDSGLPNVIVRVSAPENEAVNLGTLVASGGSIDLHGGVRNQEGIVRADSVGTDAAGRLVLRASDSVLLSEDSQTSASGGEVQVAALNVSNRGHIDGLEIRVNAEQILQQGQISAPAGRIILAAGSTADLDDLAGVSDPSSSSGSVRLGTGNPEGLAGNSAVADTAVATTEPWRFGGVLFSKTASAPGIVRNEGTITTSPGGSVSLLGTQVINTGLISTVGGSTALIAGDRVGMGFAGDGAVRYQVEAAAANALVQHSGRVDADGGRVLMKASPKDSPLDISLNVEGSVRARGNHLRSGEINLDGGSGVVSVSGHLDVSSLDATRSGGEIRILGERVGLFEQARIDASGTAGGGTILIGGNYQGKGSESNARQTYVGANVVISADAGSSGDGGKVIVWADDWTRYHGTTSARGGEQSGDGGFVEVSGKQNLTFDGDVVTSAAKGQAGMLLLDPGNLYFSAIAAGGATELTGPSVFQTANATDPFYVLSKSFVRDSSYTLEAHTDFILNTDAIFGSAAGHTVNITAGNSILSNNFAITTGGADLILDAQSMTLGAVSTGGTLIITVTGAGQALRLGPTTVGGTAAIAASGPVRQSGDLRVGGAVQISADSLTIDPAGGIISAAPGDAITVVAAVFDNRAGASAFSTPNGRWLVYAADPATSSEGFATYNKHYDQPYTGTTPAYAATDNWFLYSVAPTLTVRPSAQAITYGEAIPSVFTPDFSGFIDGDTPATAGISGAATWTTAGPTSSSGNLIAGGHDMTLTGGLTSSFGYRFADDKSSTNELTVNPKTLTAAYSASPKTYDGTTTATVSGSSPDLVAGDSVSFSQNAAFRDKNVGLAKPIDVTAIVLGGPDAFNYALAGATASTSADITGRTLTVVYTASPKTYDGTTMATVSGSLPGLVAGDSVSFSQNAAFRDKNVGLAKPIDITAIALGGPDALKYALTSTTASTSADIIARALTAIYTGSPKAYDGTTTATVSGSSPDLVAGDSVSFSQNAAFRDKNVGLGKPIDVTAITLGGRDALNYALTSATASTSADIFARALTVVYTASPKAYDGTTTATVSGSLPDLVAGDSVSFSQNAAFRDKNVGVAKPIDVTAIALGGPDALKYALTSTTASTSADIIARALTAVYTGSPKTYDGTTTATVSGSSPDLVAGDSVSFSQNAAFRDKNVGLGKPIDVTAITLGGRDARNYALTTATASTSADIFARALTVVYTASPKTYDGTTTATVSGSLPDLVAGDSVSFSQNAAFRDKNVGVAKPIDVTAIALGGPDALKYALTSATASTSADIIARALTAVYTGSPKTYDGTTTATVSGSSPDLVAGDSVSFSQNAAFRDKNVGLGKPIDVTAITLGGRDALNYALTGVTASTSADVFARALTAVYTASAKTYDGTTITTVSGSSPDLVAGDSVSFSQNAAFRDKNVGLAKPIDVTTIALGGPDAFNYALASATASTSADIIARALTVVYAASPKTYDGTTTATVSGSSPDIIAGNSVSFSQLVAFRDKNVGLAKPIDVTAIALDGADALNYVLTSTTASTSADITAKSLTVAYTGSNKVYDGTTAATVNASSPDLIPGDVISFSQDAAFRNTYIGLAKPIDVTAIALGGPDATNYALTSTTALTVAATLPPKGVNPSVYGIPLPEAVQAAVEGVNTAVRLALPVVAPEKSRVTDLTTAVVSFTSLNLAHMSRDQMEHLLALRQEFKSKLFADTIYKLELDPSLAEVRPCASLAEVSSGLCRMTDAQRGEFAAQAPATETPRSGRRARLVKLPQIERKVAVLFGVNDYTDRNIPQLTNAVPDAEMVGTLMADRLGYEVRVVKNPSKADIVRTLNELSVDVSRNDSVIIYYAGHGYLIDKTGVGYWLPSDASSRSPKQWLSNADVSRMLAAISARQVAMISDSCYSGAFTKEREVGLSGEEIRPEEILARRSVVVMSSGGDEPVPDGGKDGHSIFAWQLSKTLGQVETWQPGTKVFKQVRRDVHEIFPQTPQYGASALAGHEAGGDYLFESRQLEEVR